jgi:hypothetical protein
MSRAVSRTARFVFASGLLGGGLFLAGCATAVKVESTPAGAAVTIGGKPAGTTPTQWQVENASKAVAVNFELNGYFPKTISYTPGSNPQPIFAELEPRKLARNIEIRSEPAGANATVAGRAVGVTPVTVPVEFSRSGPGDPWEALRVELTKTNYQAESFSLTATMTTLPVPRLELLRDERVYAITAANLDGATLNAEVTLEGKPVGKTPLRLPITYQRNDKSRPWPKFRLSVELPGQYKPQVLELDYARETKVSLKLEAVTEITTRIYSPMVTLTPVGAAFKMEERQMTGTLRTSDDSAAVSDLKQVTQYTRQDMRQANRVETINSFAVTPDGQSVVFSLTEVDESGGRYSTLKIKRADDPASGVSTLTTGTRYFDTQPYMANDGGNYLVFTSNRGERNKSDIFRVNLVEGKIVGGLARLTTDNRFNYWPTYGDSNRQLFYLSVEPAYPKAEVQLSSIRFDGSLPTQLPVVAEQINNTHSDKVFLVKPDLETKKQQLFSITADGKLETALINDESFRKANCFHPCVRANGQRVLFVSDRVAGTNERPNNNLYIVNADGTNLQQLTTNESDDTLPQWSPTEEGVVFFLSTRGGAANIWRFRVSGSR